MKLYSPPKLQPHALYSRVGSESTLKAIGNFEEPAMQMVDFLAGISPSSLLRIAEVLRCSATIGMQLEA